MKMNIEYEYSFKVDCVEKYIQYCENNNYEKKSENRQIRKLYKNDTDIMGRITINYVDGNEIIEFDFKNNNQTKNILKESEETIPLIIKNQDLNSIESILKFFNLKLDKVLDRTRLVYVKKNIKFEIDKYVSPEIMNVIGIEGKKEEVDIIYKKVINNI